MIVMRRDHQRSACRTRFGDLRAGVVAGEEQQAQADPGPRKGGRDGGQALPAALADEQGQHRAADQVGQQRPGVGQDGVDPGSRCGVGDVQVVVAQQRP